MTRHSLLVVFLAACGGSSAAPPPVAPAPAPAPVAAGPTCGSTAEKMVALRGAGEPDDLPPEAQARTKARFTAALADACTEAHWPAAFLACIDKAGDADAAAACDQHIDDETRAKSVARMESLTAEELMADVAERSQVASNEIDPSDLPDDAWLTTLRSQRTRLVECDQYFATFADYLACDKVPAQARAATKQALDAMTTGFAQLHDPSVTAEARRAASDACLAGRRALLESAQVLGCKVAP